MKNVDKLIEQHKKRSRRKKLLQGFRKAIDITSSIASTLLLVREKPRMLDYLSVGVALTNTGIRIHDEISRLSVVDPREFYNPVSHYIIPFTLEKTLFQFITNEEALLINDKTTLKHGFLLNYEIFWIEEDKNKQKPFCKIEEKENVIYSIGELLWHHSGTSNVTLDKTGELMASDESLDFEVVETRAMQELEKRIRSFKDHGITRAYLLDGPPGTGKSSAAMYLIQKMGLRSVRASLSSIYGGEWQDQGSAVGNLDVLLKALQPDMIIVDDIDRVYMGEQQMLKLFETARKYCKIIMATCNNKSSMIGAMLRVGRFDDHIEINRLDPEVVMGMLDEEDADLAERMSVWPIAYIQNYKTVKKVMGREQARYEIDDMEDRIFEIEDKTKKEGALKYQRTSKEESRKKDSKKELMEFARKNLAKRKKKRYKKVEITKSLEAGSDIGEEISLEKTNDEIH